MPHHSWPTAALASAGLLLSTGAIAATPAAPPATPAWHSAGVTHHTYAPEVDPDAVSAIRQMSAYLRTLTTFEVSSTTLREEVDDAGQKLQFTGSTDYKVRRPNGFLIEIAEDRRIRDFYYDGKSLTVFAPRMGYYTTVAAPPTIAQTLDEAADKYQISLPLEDLFRWGQGDDGAEVLTSAYHVGYAKIAGQDADQFAFRQRGVDWQIWIARGDKPLPLRVVVTSTSDPVRPQFQADLTWNTAPQFADATFTFQAPSDSKAIGIASNP